jgi:hypothetical protein
VERNEEDRIERKKKEVRVENSERGFEIINDA